MGEIGSGTCPAWPADYDTNLNQEVNDPAADATYVTAETMNDVCNIAIKLEEIIGLNPRGTADTLADRIDEEHNADGTHNGSTTVVTKTATQTLTNKTLTSPVLGGTVTGTYTLGGTPTITAPTITGNWGGGTMTSGTVPLARSAGAALLDGSTAVNANTVTSISIQSPGASHRFYIYSIRGSSTVRWAHGAAVLADETISSGTPHSYIGRPSSGTDDVLNLVNGTGSSVTAEYKLYQFVET